MTNQIFVNANVPSDDRDSNALKDIWKIYAHEAMEFDRHRINNLHKSLDVRLIFVRSCPTHPFFIPMCLYCCI